MPLTTRPFDVAEYLTDDEMISEYLTDAFEDDDDPRGVGRALGDVVRAKSSVQQLAATTGLAEEELRRAFAGDCVLDLAKILKLLHALGIKLSASVTNDTSVAA